LTGIVREDDIAFPYLLEVLGCGSRHDRDLPWPRQSDPVRSARRQKPCCSHALQL